MKPDKDVTVFIDEVIDSLVVWELLVFLWQNPGVTDRAEGISARLGRRREDVLGPLQALRRAGVLEAWGDDQNPVFSFHPDARQAERLDKFMHLHQDKEGKLWIWSQLLHKGLR